MKEQNNKKGKPFEYAFYLLKSGMPVTRKSWAFGTYVASLRPLYLNFMIPTSIEWMYHDWSDSELAHIPNMSTFTKKILTGYVLCTKDSEECTPWVPSSADMEANDWTRVTSY